MQEAYSHEVISAAGGRAAAKCRAAFYCYAAPEPQGFASESASGAGVLSSTLGEFLLMNEDVRRGLAHCGSAGIPGKHL